MPQIPPWNDQTRQGELAWALTDVGNCVDPLSGDVAALGMILHDWGLGISREAIHLGERQRRQYHARHIRRRQRHRAGKPISYARLIGLWLPGLVDVKLTGGNQP
jgi:hypothetical protein